MMNLFPVEVVSVMVVDVQLSRGRADTINTGG